VNELDTLLSGFAPAARPQRRQGTPAPDDGMLPSRMLGAAGTAITAQRAKTLGPYDAIMGLLGGMDPLLRAVSQSAIEDALSLPRGSIPSQEEDTLQKLQFQQRTFAAHKSLLVDKVMDVQATIADLPDEVKAKIEMDEDTLESDPKRWIAYAKAIGSDLTPGDLMRAGMLKTPDEIAAKQTKEKSDAAQEDVASTSRLRQKLEDLKALNVGTSKTPALLAEADFPGQAKAAIEKQGEAMDTDLLPAKWEFWTGPDANTLQGLERAYLNEGRALASPMLKPLAARGFLEAAGEQIGRVLNTAQKGRIKTKEGDQTRVMVGDEPAVLHAAHLALLLAQDGGMDISDVLTKLGVDANAIDLDSYKAAAAKVSGE